MINPCSHFMPMRVSGKGKAKIVPYKEKKGGEKRKDARKTRTPIKKKTIVANEERFAVPHSLET